MQGKGIVKFFLVALAVVSLLQFIFMIPTWRVENKADSYASSNCPEGKGSACYKMERANFLDSISSETVFKIPLLKSYTYQELKGTQLGFGLDLKGGMSILLQVDLTDFIRAMSGTATDKQVEDALALATKKQKSTQADFITLFAQAWKEVAPDRPLNSVFKRNESLKDEVNASTSDQQMVTLLRREADATVGRTYELLKQRIDKLGVVGPNVSLDAGRDLILVELPGIDNPQRARNFLQAAAKLEFWNVYRVSDGAMGTAFSQANEKLKKIQAGEVDVPVVKDSLSTDSADVAVTDTTSKTPEKDTTALDLTATSGPLFDIFTPNDGSLGLAPMGTANKNKRRAITEMLNKPGVRELFPNDVMFLWSRKPTKDANGKELKDTYELYAIKKEPGKNTAPLEGDHVTDAAASPDPTTGELSISLKMDGEGARIWGAMTQKAANDNNREIAIVLDSGVVSAPRVINPILSGDSQITGSYSLEEAQDVAKILEIGKLPARTQIIQESLIGPSLGAENISTSFKSLIAGFMLVLIFMVLYYGGAGVVSIIVLFLNVVFLVGIVASYGTVLTLPGVAGIVLTIGMAVDANVVIFERVKEELRKGKTLAVAVRDGYKHSYSAIIDGHVTTILTAFVLFFFGLGPIKGFAVVLIAGIATSLFTAVLVSRLMIENWLGKGKSLSFWTERTKNVLSNLHVDWMGKRKIFYMVSLTITVAGLISFFARGFDLGVDFKGGYSMNVQFEGQAPKSEEIRNSLTTAFGKTPVVKAVDSENTYNVITDYLLADQAEDTPDKVLAKLHEGLSTLGVKSTLDDFKNPDGNGTHVTSFSKTGPTVADDIQRSAWKAIIVGLLVIFLYILIRFSRWQFSLGAVIATAHDSFVVLAVFSIFHGLLPWSMEIDQAFIAAILTIIGYSVNDTVIVYDRIREYFTLYPDQDKHTVINRAINSTMSRTLYSSLTTLFTVLVLWMFGSGSIKGFAFALVVGIVAGTYSSVFIASPIMADLSKSDIRITNRTAKDEDKKSFTKSKAKA